MKRLLCLLCGMVIITSFSFSQTKEKKEINLKKEPNILFEKTVHDFGKINKNSDGTYLFYFTNSGNAPLVIHKIDANCGCTTPSYPKQKPIKPQDTAFVKVKYNTGITGKFHKTISVHTNTEDSPIKLRIKGIVREKED